MGGNRPLDLAAADLAEGLPFIDLHMTKAKEFATTYPQISGSSELAATIP